MSILSVGSYIIIIIIMIDYSYLPSGRGGNVLMLVTVSFRCLSVCLQGCSRYALPCYYYYCLSNAMH